MARPHIDAAVLLKVLARVKAGDFGPKAKLFTDGGYAKLEIPGLDADHLIVLTPPRLQALADGMTLAEANGIKPAPAARKLKLKPTLVRRSMARSKQVDRKRSRAKQAVGLTQMDWRVGAERP